MRFDLISSHKDELDINPTQFIPTQVADVLQGIDANNVSSD
jgi:hypothetical protein